MENFNEQEYLKYKEYMLNKLGERDSLIKHVKLGYFGELNKDDVISPFFPRFVKEWCGDIELRELSIYLNTTSRQYDELLYDRQELESILKNREALKQIFPQIAEKVEIFCVEKNIYSSNSTTKGIRKDVKVPSFDKVEHTLPEVIYANKIIETISEKINSKNLSPFEKFYLCYLIVSENVVYLKENSKQYSPHSLISTLTQMHGCCMGKSLMLQKFLQLTGINSAPICISSDNLQAEYERKHAYLKENTNKNWTKPFKLASFELRKQFNRLKKAFVSNKSELDHMMNLVYLNDKKYGINGVFGVDVTNFDAFIKLQPILDYAFTSSSFIGGTEFVDKFLKKVYNPEVEEDKKEYYEKLKSEQDVTEKLFKSFDPMTFIINLEKKYEIKNFVVLYEWAKKKFDYETMSEDEKKDLKKVVDNFSSNMEACKSWYDLKNLTESDSDNSDISKKFYKYMNEEVVEQINSIFDQANAVNDLRWVKQAEEPNENDIDICENNVIDTYNEIVNDVKNIFKANDIPVLCN